QLTGTSDSGTSFTWTGPNGFHSTEQHPVIPNATESATGTYFLTATTGDCSGYSQVEVVVHRAPQITAITADPETICAGHSTQLEVVAVVPALDYCIPEFPYPGETCIYGTLIQSVVFAGIERTSECDGNVAEGVSFFSSPQAHVVAGNSYTMTVA